MTKLQSIQATIRGRRQVQQNERSLSYRNRGKTLRKKRLNKRNLMIPALVPPKKSSPVNQAKQTTIPYSPTKTKAKSTLPSSRLNPLISSLSPSAKSKGARLVSAMTLNLQAGKAQRAISALHKSHEVCFVSRTLDKTISANLTSYLTLCVQARIPPRNPYLDVLLSPLRSTP